MQLWLDSAVAYNWSMSTSERTSESPAPHALLWYGEQDANGVDLSLIRENLKLTPRERLLRGDQARRSALRLLEYGRRQRDTNARPERT
jgi:hypothetical protein